MTHQFFPLGDTQHCRCFLLGLLHLRVDSFQEGESGRGDPCDGERPSLGSRTRAISLRLTNAGAAVELLKQGYRVEEMEGGYATWTAAGYPVEQEAAREAPVAV